MTKAAEQCREYVEGKWPDAPIGRFACRDTASGNISQHSAYNGYDSNALDIFAPGHGSDAQSQAYIQMIVDDLTPRIFEWSIRKIIFKDGGAHENHAHVDFYPMCLEHKWCGRSITPEWRDSVGGVTASRDPMPENGLYDGGGDEEMKWSDIVDDATWTKAYEDGFIQGDPAVMPQYYFAGGPATEDEKKNGYNHIMREQMDRT